MCIRDSSCSLSAVHEHRLVWRARPSLLRSCQLQAQAEQLFYWSCWHGKFPLFADPTLSVENLVRVMEKVTSDKRRNVWEKVLKWRYQTPFTCLDEVYTKYTTDKETTHALADLYINIRPESSWQHFVQTLYDESELAAAKEVKSFLQQNGGWCCSVVHVYLCAVIMCTLQLCDVNQL